MASGRNNARRRRVILDDAVQSAAVQPVVSSNPASAGSSKKKLYSSAAKRRGQLKTTDLIPKRRWPLAMVTGVVLIAFAVVNLLAVYATQWPVLSTDAMQAFRITGIGTVSNWFSSLLLMVTGMASLQIYGMRKHRCDDYNGHYRIWLFLAVIFVVASINCVVDFRAIANSLSNAAGFSGQNGMVVLLVIKMVALTGLVVRGILEIRASQGALVAVVVVWVAYASAIIAQIPAVRSELVQNEEFIVGNLFLIGTLATFFTVVIYSRYVYLHANDLIKVAAKKVKTREAAVSKEAASKSTKTEVKPEISAKPAAQVKPAAPSKPAAQPAQKVKLAKTNAVETSGRVSSANPPAQSTPTPAVQEAGAGEASEQDQKILSMPLGKKLNRSARKRLKKQTGQQRKAA